jgi:hypothetical protein
MNPQRQGTFAMAEHTRKTALPALVLVVAKMNHVPIRDPTAKRSGPVTSSRWRFAVGVRLLRQSVLLGRKPFFKESQQ